MVWHNRTFGGKWPVTINFQFAGDVKLNRAKIHFTWGARSFGLRDIKIFGKNGVGKFIPLASVSPKHPYARPKDKPAIDCIELKSDDDTAVSEIQVMISGTGHYLGLFEIEFDGTLIPPKKVKLESNPMEALIAQAKPGLRLYRFGKYYVLENDKSIYAVDPAYCGAVNFAYDKIAMYAPFADERSTFSASSTLWGKALRKAVVSSSKQVCDNKPIDCSNRIDRKRQRLVILLIQ